MDTRTIYNSTNIIIPIIAITIMPGSIPSEFKILLSIFDPLFGLSSSCSPQTPSSVIERLPSLVKADIRSLPASSPLFITPRTPAEDFPDSVKCFT